MQKLHVAIQDKPRSYDIMIGENLLDQAGSLIEDVLGLRRLVVITDENVAPLYLQQVEIALQKSGHTLLPAIILPAGESTKSMQVFERLMNDLFARKADRKTVFIALGGGVIGDIVGFAGSTFMRGVDVVQIPTTLLAQVDSSVGGKTAIDTAYGKNTIGAFFQPRLVITDVGTLETLPPRDLLCGYAETVKYALICDKAFFDWCEDNALTLISGDKESRTQARIYAIQKSCAHKAEIVAQDEHDQGIRELLNLGHTFGHPLESLAGYGHDLLHGEAVAIGMVLAFEFSVKSGFCAAEDAQKVKAHFEKTGLPTTLPNIPVFRDCDSIMQYMAQDKKSDAGKMTLILAHAIGNAFRQKNADIQAVKDLWDEKTKA